MQCSNHAHIQPKEDWLTPKSPHVHSASIQPKGRRVLLSTTHFPTILWTPVKWCFVVILGYLITAYLFSWLAPLINFCLVLINGVTFLFHFPGMITQAFLSLPSSNSSWSTIQAWPQSFACLVIGTACQRSARFSAPIPTGDGDIPSITAFDLGTVYHELFHEATTTRTLVNHVIYTANGSAVRSVMQQRSDLLRFAVDIEAGTHVPNRAQLSAEIQEIGASLQHLLDSLITLNSHGTLALSIFIQDFIYLEREACSLGLSVTPEVLAAFDKRMTDFVERVSSLVAELSAHVYASYALAASIEASERRIQLSLAKTAAALGDQANALNPVYRFVYPFTVEGHQNADDRSLLLSDVSCMQDMADKLAALHTWLGYFLRSSEGLWRRIDGRKPQDFILDPAEELRKFQAVVMDLSEAKKTFPEVFDLHGIQQ